MRAEEWQKKLDGAREIATRTFARYQRVQARQVWARARHDSNLAEALLKIGASAVAEAAR